MAKKTKLLPLLFVDTNIFLNFYRARGEAGLILLERLETVWHSLILTDQVEVEFVNNRQNVIAETLKGINAPTIPVPAYLVASRVATSIEKHQTKIRAQIKVLTEKVNRLVKDPAKHDPVLRMFKKLMARSSPLNLKWADAETHKRICDKAMLRYHRHFPPRKQKDHGIGDAINWEWIKHCSIISERDVIVVTEDSDFGDKVLLDCLSQEFASHTSRKAELVPKLSEALKRLDVKVTAAEEREEEILTLPSIEEWDKAIKLLKAYKASKFVEPDLSKLIVKTPMQKFPAFWFEFLNRLSEKDTGAASTMSSASFVTFKDNRIAMYFPSKLLGALSNNSVAMSKILETFKEMGMETCSIEFKHEGEANEQ